MPNWNELLDEIIATPVTNSGPTAHDIVRRRHLKRISEITRRNTILYYSGWLQRPELASQNTPGFLVDDLDKNGFMATIHELDRALGLDLVLHTPGGSVSATESLVHYLRSMFPNNIRVIVPQMAMSAGTMIACACQEIVMGKHSSLGPIDPQTNGLPAHGIIEEFKQALGDVTTNPLTAHIWQPIISQYYPTLVGDCQNAIDWANQMVQTWLATGMFEGDPQAADKSKAIIFELADHARTKAHNRQISIVKAAEIGLKVVALEDNQELQDAVLSTHHAAMQTLTDFDLFKLIENQNEVAVFRNITKTA